MGGEQQAILTRLVRSIGEHSSIFLLLGSNPCILWKCVDKYWECPGYILNVKPIAFTPGLTM